MSWFVYSLLAMACYSVLGILFKLVSNEKTNPYFVSFMYMVLSSAFTFPLIFIREGFNFNVPLIVWLALLASAVVYTLASVFNFKAYAATDAATATILTRSFLLWVLIGGVIIFKENLTTKQIIGCLLIIASVIVLGLSSARIKFKTGELFGIFSGLFFGAGALFDKGLLKYFNLTWYQFLSLFLTGILVFVTFRKRMNFAATVKSKQTLSVIAAMGALLTLGNIFLFSAYQNQGYVSLTNMITQLRIPVIFLYGFLFLRERERLPNKIVSTVFLITGAVLLK